MNHLILTIGASGLIGENLLRAASDAGFGAIGTYHSHPVTGMQQLDIRNMSEVRSVIKLFHPTIICLPAALANVDYCETHRKESRITNVTGVCNVVKAANEVGAKLVYFSTDYIFEGRAGPYYENDIANPINEYGLQKLIAEHYIALHGLDYLIVRTTVVYGWERQGKNFIYRLLNTLNAGNILMVPVDQIGTPTYAPNLAQAVIELALADARGVYHVVGPKQANRYEFACEAARVFRLDSSLIQAVSTCELGQVAPRPLNAGLVAEKATSELIVQLIDYQNGLRAMASERAWDK